MWLRDLTGKRITESTKKINIYIIYISFRLSVKGICVKMCLLILRVRKQAPSAHIRGWMCFQCCAVFLNTHSGSGFTLSVWICTANTPLPLGNTHLAVTSGKPRACHELTYQKLRYKYNQRSEHLKSYHDRWCMSNLFSLLCNKQTYIFSEYALLRSLWKKR